MQTALKNKDNILLVVSQVGENHAWYVVEATGVKKALLESKVGKEHLDLKEYGEVLYSGWGTEPPEDIKTKLKEDYNAT